MFEIRLKDLIGTKVIRRGPHVAEKKLSRRRSEEVESGWYVDPYKKITNNLNLKDDEKNIGIKIKQDFTH